MIRHTVVFKLKHPKNSKAETAFLNAAIRLSQIPGVRNFECLRQVGKKNDFDFGLSMDFDNQQVYDDYLNHTDHKNFVQDIWLKEVDQLLEIDYAPL